MLPAGLLKLSIRLKRPINPAADDAFALNRFRKDGSRVPVLVALRDFRVEPR